MTETTTPEAAQGQQVAHERMVMRCPKCRVNATQVERGALFCDECGHTERQAHIQPVPLRGIGPYWRGK